jgi:hypothetical protein
MVIPVFLPDCILGFDGIFIFPAMENLCQRVFCEARFFAAANSVYGV